MNERHNVVTPNCCGIASARSIDKCMGCEFNKVCIDELNRIKSTVAPRPPMEANVYALTDKVAKWADSIIPNRTPEMAFRKLQKEIEEWAERPADGHEAADVFLLLLDVCHLTGIDLVKALHHKMRINNQRTWEIGKDGLLQHVKTSGRS